MDKPHPIASRSYHTNNVRNFIDDFISYVVLTVRGTDWRGHDRNKAADDCFTPEIGDFIMSMSAEERRGYSASIADAFLKKNFLLRDYRKRFGSSFSHLFYTFGYTNSSAIYRMFGYTAEAALVFSEIANGRGIRFAATTLFEFLIHSYIPLFMRDRSLTLITYIKTELEMCRTLALGTSHLSTKERKCSEIIKASEYLRKYVIKEVSNDEWENMKTRWRKDADELLQEIRQQEQDDEHAMYLTVPPDEYTWFEATNETKKFVTCYIQYAVSKIKPSIRLYIKGNKPSRFFTEVAGRNILMHTREVRVIYAETLQEFYNCGDFDLNKYPELFYSYGIELFRNPYRSVNIIRVFNMFGYSAEAAAAFSDVEGGRGIKMVIIMLYQFIVSVILKGLLRKGGYSYFVRCLETMPDRISECRESIEEYQQFLQQQRRSVLRVRKNCQIAKRKGFVPYAQCPVFVSRNETSWSMDQRWNNEPDEWAPPQLKARRELFQVRDVPSITRNTKV